MYLLPLHLRITTKYIGLLLLVLLPGCTQPVFVINNKDDPLPTREELQKHKGFIAIIDSPTQTPHTEKVSVVPVSVPTTVTPPTKAEPPVVAPVTPPTIVPTITPKATALGNVVSVPEVESAVPYVSVKPQSVPAPPPQEDDSMSSIYTIVVIVILLFVLVWAWRPTKNDSATRAATPSLATSPTTGQSYATYSPLTGSEVSTADDSEEPAHRNNDNAGQSEDVQPEDDSVARRIFKERDSADAQQNFLESRRHFNDRTSKTSLNEHIVEELTDAEPKQGFFEDDDDYRERVHDESREAIIEAHTGDKPKQGFFEDDDEYQERIEEESRDAIIESTQGEISQGLFESDDSYEERKETAYQESIIESATGEVPEKGFFEDEDDYRDRIAREAENIKRDNDD